MKCLKCGAELNSSYEMPLCRNCESKEGHVFKLSDPSEVLEFHINSQKEHGNLPKGFKLSDAARTVAKNMIYKLLERGEKSESITNAIFGFCYGYLCCQKEHKDYL